MHPYHIISRRFPTTIQDIDENGIGYLCSGVIPCSLSRLGFPSPSRYRRTPHTSPFKAAECTSIPCLAGNSSHSQHQTPDIADRTRAAAVFFSLGNDSQPPSEHAYPMFESTASPKLRTCSSAAPQTAYRLRCQREMEPAAPSFMCGVGAFVAAPPLPGLNSAWLSPRQGSGIIRRRRWGVLPLACQLEVRRQQQRQQ